MSRDAAHDTQTQPALGILAGSGDLPLRIAEACKTSGRPFFMLAFEEAPEAALACGGPHAVVRLGALGDTLAHLRSAGARDLVLAGKIRRPSFSALRPDKAGAQLLARLGRAIFAGDDALLRAIVGYFEQEGFRVVGAQEVLTQLLAPAGVMGRHAPDEQARADIAHGLRVAATLGELDVGQAVVVERGYVLGVEAAEGTDALLERCAVLKREPARGGVLVKRSKPAQDRRADLPAIGLATVRATHAAGLAGIALQSGGTLVLEKDATLAEADRLGLFIMGVQDE